MLRACDFPTATAGLWKVPPLPRGIVEPRRRLLPASLTVLVPRNGNPDPATATSTAQPNEASRGATTMVAGRRTRSGNSSIVSASDSSCSRSRRREAGVRSHSRTSASRRFARTGWTARGTLEGGEAVDRHGSRVHDVPSGEGREGRTIQSRRRPRSPKRAPRLCRSPHDLRHSAASVLIAAGVELVEVSMLLGHAEIRTTADRYPHLVKQTAAKASWPEPRRGRPSAAVSGQRITVQPETRLSFTLAKDLSLPRSAVDSYRQPAWTSIQHQRSRAMTTRAQPWGEPSFSSDPLRRHRRRPSKSTFSARRRRGREFTRRSPEVAESL